MPLIVRLGDTSSHGGTVISSAAKWQVEGALVARKGDLHSCPIHGVTPIISGSAKYGCEGEPIARDGDLCGCGAVLISGASKWECV